MAGLKTELLSDVAGTGSPAVTKADFIKSWINFNNRTTTTILDSFNISSITDVGVGDTTVTYTNAFASSNYGKAGLLGDSLAINGSYLYAFNTASASNVRLRAIQGSGTLTDYDNNGFMAAGDLA